MTETEAREAIAKCGAANVEFYQLLVEGKPATVVVFERAYDGETVRNGVMLPMDEALPVLVKWSTEACGQDNLEVA